MKQVMHVIAILVLVTAAGCGKKKAEDGGGSGTGTGTGSAGSSGPTRRMGLQTGQDCDRLGTKTSVDSMAMTPPGTPDDQRAKLQAISDEAGAAIAALCKSDAWSGEAVACGLSAKDPAKECDGKLTPEQKQKLEATVMPIFAKGAAAMAGTMGSGAAPAPEGSAAPAPAGSAAPAPAGSAAPTTP